LRPGLVELDGEAGLLDLSGERALLRRDVEEPDDLLRDRRATLDDPAGAKVGPERARDPLVVDAAVVVEAAILDRHRGRPHPRADVLQRNRLAVLLGRNRPEELAVGGVDEGVVAERCRSERGKVAARAEGGSTPEADDDD